MNLNEYIRDVADFPVEGILFKDITPLLYDGKAFKQAIDELLQCVDSLKFDLIAAPESRGFIFGVPLALELGIPFIPIRKPGKLPYKTVGYEYDLEYGTDQVEMHVDAVNSGDRVLVVDDLLATGGTVNACCELISREGGMVAGCVFLIELSFLNGREILGDYVTKSLISY